MARSASRIGSVVAVALALCITAPAAAQKNDVARAKRQYMLGYKHLQAANYERALRHYKRSYEIVSRPRTLFNIAVCYEKMNRHKQALRSYEDFAQLAQTRDRKFLTEAKLKIAVLRKRLEARVVVRSRPSGAKVFVDGGDTARGVTPLTLTLRDGQHRLKLTLPGAVSERHITVRGQQRMDKTFVLKQKAIVEIQTEPRDALIRMSGSRKTRVGKYRTKLRLGKHQFVVTRKGYANERINVVVKAGHIHERIVRMRPLPGKALLVVQTNNAGARVSVDGLLVGTTSLATARAGGHARLSRPLKNGRHVLIVDSGNRSWSKRIHLSPGERISVNVNFGGASTVKTWGLATLGAVSVAVGGLLGVRAIKDVRTDMQTTHDRGKDRALLADVLLVGGAAALISSWYFKGKATTKASVERSYERKK